MPNLENLKIFSGATHSTLALDVSAYVDIPLGKATVSKFANGNTFVQYQENIRQQDVFIVQPFGHPVNDSIMELLIMIDAAKRASAGRITAVIPYYAYGRTDKKDQPRVPITARLLADLIEVAGAHRVLTLDLHAGQIQGFFSIPVDELTALPLLTSYFRQKELTNPVVVAVDIGISKRARDMANNLGVPLAIIEKRRLGNNDSTEVLNVIGDVAGKTAITFDDETDTGGSLTSAVQAAIDAGATEVYSCSTHGVFTNPALDRINTSNIREMVVTDTLPSATRADSSKVKVLSVASLLGEAICRIHEGRSVGELFADAQMAS
ncbi:MAG: ribose-phosphate pyrophosphokinase [Chloroflexota bacterium]|nr:ribose-phosphate pyrophosphokinase [Chloroflexota bacterium]